MVNWPESYDDFDIRGNPVRSDLVARMQQIYDTLEAIQHELGLNPSGASADVSARLDAADVTLSNEVDALNTSIASQFSELVDAADPFPGANYAQMTTTGGSREIYVQASEPTTEGPDGAIWVDTSA